VLHLRPREWPIVAGHTLFGYLVALPTAPAAGERWGTAFVGIVLFVVCLNGGTLAINSAFDRDEGDIGYLDAPPPPPRHLFAFGLTLMLLGLGIAALILPRSFVLVYAACLVLSLLYSVPPFRWKAVAGLDLAVDAADFGTLATLAGWTLTESALPLWALIVLLSFAPLFAALYPLTQFYQYEEDRARGDRTLALALGIRRSLLLAIAMTVVAFTGFMVGLRLGPTGYGWLLAAIPFVAWMSLLLRWLARWPTMSPLEHKRGMYTALKAWVLTDLSILVAVLGPTLA